MKNIFFRIYIKIVSILCLPIFLADYFKRETGREYNVGFWKKCRLALIMYWNTKKIISATYFLEHLKMATNILNIPKSVEGVVVECGSYKGASATNISLVCGLCSRQLEIFDSFEGLPEIKEEDKKHILISSAKIYNFSGSDGKGAWKGSLQEVELNISRYGDIKVCHFNKGFFKDTLPLFKKKAVFIFLDVDLKESLEDCLKNLWPLLQDNCFLYTHEAEHMEIASLFFVNIWWRDYIKVSPPGLVGAGNGLAITPSRGTYFNSSLGYTVKNPKLIDVNG